MKKGTNKLITEEDGDIVLENGKIIKINAKNELGIVDLTDEGRKVTALKFKINSEKPWRGMKYFPEYSVYAINEKNAKRKQKISNE